MIDHSSLSATTSLLRPFVNAVLNHFPRLHAERQAGTMPITQPTDMMGDTLNESLDRLRGGNIEDAWWRNILSKFGQQYISPDFLKKPALQEWLAVDQVATDFKTLVITHLMMGPEDNAKARIRLIESYSERTGEANQLATGPIDVVMAVLVAGYIASIPSDQRASTGIIQTGFKRTEDRLDHVEKLLSQGTPDPITQEAHTKEAEAELSKILLFRVIDPLGSRSKIQTLLNRTRGDDLSAASSRTKTKICYWAARLCAVYTESLETARQLREKLVQIDPEMCLTILDALLAEAIGNNDEALRLVRDRDEPDFRSTFLYILARSQGERAALDWYEQANACDDPNFFTSVGWINWAVCLTKLEKWEEASRQLIKLETHWSEAPVLAFVEGRIHAAMLLPEEYRSRVMIDVPIYNGITPIQGLKAENHHSRATTCFKFVNENFADTSDQHFMKFVTDWHLWLQLVNPNTLKANAARKEIENRMDDESQAIDLILFASVFEIPFNTKPLSQNLDKKRQYGGLNDQELLAESLLFQKSMSPREFFTYLEKHRVRLLKVLNPAFLATMQVNALVSDGQTERARDLISLYANDLGDVHADRFKLAIDAQEGNDPRACLESFYNNTNSLQDLRVLVSHLKSVNDRVALLPLVIALFDREPTIENALDVIRYMGEPTSFGHESVIKFLETNSDLVTQNEDLKAAKAWALFHSGRLQDAQEINDGLLKGRANQDDFHLDINIAVASGHWERIESIIDREWPKRNSHDPQTLISLACLSGQRGQSPDRALQLAKLAAEKGSNEPRILAAAYWLHFKLQREDEADPSWLTRASELSSTEDGPIWNMELKDIVNDFLPKRRSFLQEVERKWLGGEIPMSIAAGVFSISLARILLHIPDQNTIQLDGRQRVMLPIISGGRSPVALQEKWVIGLDITSVMVLSYVNLLEQTIDMFFHVKLAPDIMEFLFRERDEAHFHQPSRIAAAKELRDLESAGQIQAANGFSHPPESLVDEVGLELAMLLHMAADDKGMVVCVRPIHRPESLMEQIADTCDHDHLILSTRDICNLLYEEGKIDTEAYERAKMVLKSQGQEQHSSLRRSGLNGPVYIDDLSVSYLQDANILKPVATAGLDIRVHPNVLKHAHALIEAGDMGLELGTKIEGIRTLLRNAVDSGAASFLPRAADRDGRNQNREPRFQTTASLLAGTAACDALCIDDRYINSHSNITDDTGRLVPVACVLDVLRNLFFSRCYRHYRSLDSTAQAAAERICFLLGRIRRIGTLADGGPSHRWSNDGKRRIKNSPPDNG